MTHNHFPVRVWVLEMISNCVLCWYFSLFLSLPLFDFSELKFVAFISFGSRKHFSSDSLRYFRKFTCFCVDIGKNYHRFRSKYLIDLLRRNTLICSCSFGYNNNKKYQVPSFFPWNSPLHIVCLFVFHFFFIFGRWIDRYCSREGKKWI